MRWHTQVKEEKFEMFKLEKSIKQGYGLSPLHLFVIHGCYEKKILESKQRNTKLHLGVKLIPNKNKLTGIYSYI